MNIQQLLEGGQARYHSARDYDIDELEHLEELLESRCSNAMAVYKEHPHSVLLRGVRGNRNDVFIQDTRSTTRTAENTDNYVTLFSEVLPSWKHLPPRSKVISTSANMTMALDYADDDPNNVFVIVPTNEATLTYVGATDFWGSLPMIYTVLGSGSGVSAFNMWFRKLLRAAGAQTPSTAQELLEWCKRFDSVAKAHEFSEVDQKNPLLVAYKKAGKPMLQFIDRILDPVNAVTSTNGRILPEEMRQEVAIYGEAVYVRHAVWELLF